MQDDCKGLSKWLAGRINARAEARAVAQEIKMIDIKAVKEQAAKEFAVEQGDKAKKALVAQMRVVETAKKILRSEELKLQDLERQITDGTL